MPLRKTSQMNEKRRTLQREKQQRGPVRQVRRIHAENYLMYKKALLQFQSLIPTAKKADIGRKVQFLAVVETMLDHLEEASIQERKKLALRQSFQNIISRVRKE